MSTSILLLANKWWEAVVLVSVLEHARDIKPEFSASPEPFDILQRRSPNERSPTARLRCRINRKIVEVWCIEDLIPAGKSTSSSFEKQSVLHSLATQGEFDKALVIAFGTAASPKENCAGNVVIGSSVFVFDPQEANSSLEIAKFESKIGECVGSASAAMLDEQIFSNAFREAHKRFLPPPNNPSSNPTIFADSSYVSVGVINVLKNEDYRKLDALALERFLLVTDGLESYSVETTHGLIRLCIDQPFLYVSGIANQVGRFAEEVQPNQYSQNFAAIHNAAICTAWMLPAITRHWFGDRTG